MSTTATPTLPARPEAAADQRPKFRLGGAQPVRQREGVVLEWVHTHMPILKDDEIVVRFVATGKLSFEAADQRVKTILAELQRRVATSPEMARCREVHGRVAALEREADARQLELDRLRLARKEACHMHDAKTLPGRLGELDQEIATAAQAASRVVDEVRGEMTAAKNDVMTEIGSALFRDSQACAEHLQQQANEALRQLVRAVSPWLERYVCLAEAAVLAESFGLGEGLADVLAKFEKLLFGAAAVGNQA